MHMSGLKIPERIKTNLDNFTTQIQQIYGEQLISVVLYGSAASGEFVTNHSNLNVLVVLKNADLPALKKASALIRKFHMLTPLFLTENDILLSAHIFPIEFLDMKENHQILYGKDIFEGMTIDTKNLKFQCEYELKNKLINLRQWYLKTHKDSRALNSLLLKAFTSSVHVLRNVIRIKNKEAAYLKEEAINEIAAEFAFAPDIWQKILSHKLKKTKLTLQETDELFIQFVRDLEKIVTRLEAQ